MTLQIQTQTMFLAPSGSPNSRRMVGVGEPVSFVANSPCAWTIPDNPIAGTRRETNVTFNRPGRMNVLATHGAERQEIVLEVVAPSIRVRKTAELSADPGLCGALMRLEFTLTPLQVSFQGIEFRECECMADEIWGYFATHRATYADVMRHDPQAGASSTPVWKSVDAQNRVAALDAAGFSMSASRLNWPITAGGFRWQIPDEYRIGLQVTRFAVSMPQNIRIEPAGGCTTAPFHGAISVRKGGEETRRVY